MNGLQPTESGNAKDCPVLCMSSKDGDGIRPPRKICISRSGEMSEGIRGGVPLALVVLTVNICGACRTADQSNEAVRVFATPQSPESLGYNADRCRSLGPITGRADGTISANLTKQQLTSHAVSDLRDQAAALGANLVHYGLPMVSDGPRVAIGANAYRCSSPPKTSDAVAKNRTTQSTLRVPSRAVTRSIPTTSRTPAPSPVLGVSNPSAPATPNLNPSEAGSNNIGVLQTNSSRGPSDKKPTQSVNGPHGGKNVGEWITPPFLPRG